MAKNNYFKFKQFTVHQEKSAMKVGTDGVLLGAWTNVEGAENILDIGTGTGLIALMLAQRSRAKIEAIEIEKNAATEANQNFLNSPWKERIAVENVSFQSFLKTSCKNYDVIVSNPPYFENSIKNLNKQMAMARHNDFLSFSDLIMGVRKLMSESGKFSLILPEKPATNFINLAAQKGLHLSRLTKIKPNPSREVNRCLMEFAFKSTVPEHNVLNIYDNSGNFSADYQKLTQYFYLNF